MSFKHKLSVRLALLKDALLLLPLTALLACEKPAGISGPGQVAAVTRVALSPTQVTLRPNQTSHFTAVGLTATGDTASVPVTWSATGGTIVDTFSSGSLHYATYQPSAVPGNYLVIATDPPETGVADTSTVTVMAVPVASVVLSPAVASLLVGATVQFTAIPQDSSGLPLAGRAVTWASSAPAVATVDANGLVTGGAAGSATITATSEGKSATAATTVTTVPVASLGVSPAAASIRVGGTQQLVAVTKDSAGATLTGRVITWSSSAPGVATVSTAGLVSGVTAGSATITATSEGKSAGSAVTVTPVPVASVVVSPPAASIVVGATQQLSAVTKDSAGGTLTGRAVTWSSSNSAVATVSSAGLVTGQTAGSAIITATSESKSGTAGITVQASGTPRPGFYVSPTGSAGGDGTANNPWDLATALSGGAGRVQPGDTIWVRGGTYRGEFTNRLSGTAGRLIVVRQYPGERATIDGDLVVGGAYTAFWGLEIMRSAPNDNVIGVFYQCVECRLINLVVHDAAASGIGFWSQRGAGGVGGELYGAILYNNGTHFNLDHGIYTQNNAGSTKLIQDNIIFNNWKYGIQAYGSIPDIVTNFHFDGNVAFGNGSISSPTVTSADYIIGGEPIVGLQFINNMSYEVPGSPNWSARLGAYATGHQDAVITGNTFVHFTQIASFVTAAVTTNLFYSPDNVLSTAGGGLTWRNNTHYRDPTAAAWGTSDLGGFTSFTTWAAGLGLGGSDQVVGTRPSGVNVVIRPNKYEAGRANIIVYNWDHLGTVSVDLSSVLTAGDRYEVRNVQDFYGAPVARGVYAGERPALPMAGTTPPAPVGRPFTPAPVTGPEFHVFVVMRTGT